MYEKFGQRKQQSPSNDGIIAGGSKVRALRMVSIRTKNVGRG